MPDGLGADGADGADGHDADDDDAAAANAPLWLRGPVEDVAEDDADDDAPVERVLVLEALVRMVPAH